MRGLRPWLWILLVAGVTAASDTRVWCAGPGEGADPTGQILARESRSERRTVGLIRARASYPQLVSAAIGLMRVRQPADYDCSTVCDHRGFLAQIEPGLGGVQLAAGYAIVVGERGANERYLSSVYVGYGVKAVLLRTWGRSPLRPEDQTFFGVEGAFTIARVSFSVGVLRGVARGTGDDPWLVSGGLGWGF